MKSAFHTLSHLALSSSSTAGSIITESNWSSAVATLRLAGGRPSELKSPWPSGERTKSAKSSAACGCGARFAKPMPSGYAITGFTATQSIGAPERLPGSTLLE